MATRVLGQVKLSQCRSLNLGDHRTARRRWVILNGKWCRYPYPSTDSIDSLEFSEACWGFCWEYPLVLACLSLYGFHEDARKYGPMQTAPISYNSLARDYESAAL